MGAEDDPAPEIGEIGIITNRWEGRVAVLTDGHPHRSRILRPEDVAAMVVAIACLPPRAHVPEIVIKPRLQGYC